MSTAWTTFKIGILTLMVVASMVVILLALGIRPGPDKTVRFRSYFDESVSGLDVGALVKYRGINVGVVDRIDLAPDGRSVEVRMKIDATRSSLLGWHAEHDTGLRARVGSPGLAGLKMIDVEFLDPAAHPPPPLTFAPGEHYVPAASASDVQQSLATMTEALVGTLQRVDAVIQDVQTREVPARVADALQSVEQAATELRSTVHHVDRARLPDRTAESMTRLDLAIGSLQKVLERVDADGGVIEGAERASESVDALGRRATDATQELDRTVRDLGEAARTMRSLGDAIERDPDMLLKGKKKGAP